MNLAKALAVEPGESVAFVGAGGKSSAMFALANELEGPVILTTTTHMGVWQSGFAGRHVIIREMEDIHHGLFAGYQSILLTGPVGDDDRLHGLRGDVLEKLQTLCKVKNLNLLIEADGAKQRPLKAPAGYEPLIPQNVDKVVVLAGLTALGKPLGPNTVHRPEIFSPITGLPKNGLIEAKDIVKLMASDVGGKKGIPKNSKNVLFLNQADDEILMSKGGRIARELIQAYDRVLVGSTEKPTTSGIVHCVYNQTAGVILAAGGSERLNAPKQLLDWQGQPFIRQMALNALEAGLSPLIVITGAYHDRVKQSLEDLQVKIVQNPDWQQGQSTSMKAGLIALPEHCDSVMFLLSDQPQISPGLIRQLIERYSQNRKPITAPIVDSQRANPMLFDRGTFSGLAAVTGDRGGRAVIDQFDVDWLSWTDKRIMMDVDQEGDYEKLKQAYYISDSD